MDSQTKQCSRCKKTKSTDAFVGKKNKILKCCSYCRDLAKKSRLKTKCIHGKRKERCIECGGISICIHKKRKARCVECDGSSICIHKKRKSQCKKCMTPEKRIKFIKQRIVYQSRHSDKSKNIYDANNFIDMCFLDGLFEDYDKCYYCKCNFTFIERCKTLVTIERKDNSIGHTKANCVLACYHCNVAHVGQRI